MEKQDFFFFSYSLELWLFEFVPDFTHDIRPFRSAQWVYSSFYANTPQVRFNTIHQP
jgi:hypothetical protein